MRWLFDRSVRILARVLLGIFYRRVEVVGLENIPAAGPLLLVANHGNALVDPALVIAYAPRMPRFLAKHTLFRHPAVRPFLNLAGSIPVYRRKDGVDPRANLDTFARSHDVLAEGGVIALFPEGISHHEPRLQPLKTGAARIALEAERERGPLGVKIVPVGLVFEEKERFRSRALVVVGEPFSIEAEVAAAARAKGDAREAVRELTRRIAKALEAVTLNTDSWEEQRLAGRASRIVSDDARAALIGDFALRQQVLDAYRDLRDRDAATADALRERLAGYEATLEVHGLRDRHVADVGSDSFAARYGLPDSLILALWSPLAAIGAAINWVPYQIVDAVARRVEDTPDQPATHKVMAGLFLFPAVWFALAGWVGSRAGAGLGALVACAMPVCAWLALRFRERGARMLRETRAYLRMRRDPERAAALRAERNALGEALRAVAAD